MERPADAGVDGFCLKGVDLLHAMELADSDSCRDDEDTDVGSRLNCPNR
jgi:hypothetical protein